MATFKIGKLEDYINPAKLYLINATANLMNSKNIEMINSKIRNLAGKTMQTTKSKAELDTSLKTSGNYTLNASVSSQRNGNVLNVQQNYSLRGQGTTNLNSSLNQVTAQKINQGQGKPAVIQTIQLDQQRNMTAISQLALDKTINSEIVSNAYKKVNGSRTETNIVSDTTQNLARQTNTNTATDTTKVVTNKNAKGVVTGESFSHRLVDEALQTAVNQQTEIEATRNIIQDVTLNKAQIGQVNLTNTQINTTDIRNSLAVISTTTTADYIADITNLNKQGEIIGTQNIHRVTDTGVNSDTETQEAINTARNITTATKGKEQVVMEKQEINGQLSQATNTAATTVVKNLDKLGNVISEQNYLTNTTSELNQASNTDINRLIKQGPAGIEGAGNMRAEVNTAINTEIESTAPSGAVTTRNIERDIENQNNVSWAGGIKVENQESGGKNYSVGNIELGNRAVVDVTREGENQLKVNTQTESAKLVSGNLSYAPAEQVQPAAGVVPASIGINFATYTGLASGFKLDTGEVNFSLSFMSSDITSQEVTKTSGEKVVSEAASQTGQMNIANLKGKLTSRITEEGNRLIEITASYNRSGAKLVAQEQGKNAEFAVGTQETELQLQGTILVSKEGNVKNVASNFDLFKVENSEAQGTGIGAVRTALSQADALGKGFSFDGGNMKFQLGFATLNFALYA